jgi:ubiquinone/menaquinone biosynthesis C-methylase UbiE
MSNTLHFNDKAAQQLLAAYTSPEMAAQRRRVNHLLELQSGEKILDIGSGPGFLASDMAEAVGLEGEVHGVDISTQLLALAADRYSHQPQLQFHQAEATRLPFADHEFDAITATQVLEYLPDVPTALTEMHRILRPGGRLLILDTDWDSIVWHAVNRNRMMRILAAWDEHLVDPYLPRTLGMKLQAAGFSLKDQQIFPLFNPSLHQDSFSNLMIDMIGSFVVGRRGISMEEADAWAKELRRLGEEGSYFFSLNRYIFIAEKLA